MMLPLTIITILHCVSVLMPAPTNCWAPATRTAGSWAAGYWSQAWKVACTGRVGESWGFSAGPVKTWQASTSR